MLQDNKSIKDVLTHGLFIVCVCVCVCVKKDVLKVQLVIFKPHHNITKILLHTFYHMYVWVCKQTCIT